MKIPRRDFYCNWLLGKCHQTAQLNSSQESSHNLQVFSFSTVYTVHVFERVSRTSANIYDSPKIQNCKKTEIVPLFVFFFECLEFVWSLIYQKKYIFVKYKIYTSSLLRYSNLKYVF